MSFNLLCCDGGGIRGIITAMLIADLDNSYGIIGNSSGFAGTSTGGLIALALANGVDIGTITNVYLNDGQTIFTPTPWDSEQELARASAKEKLGSGPGDYYCAYTDAGLIQVADYLLGASTLAGASKFVAVNSAQLWDGTSWMAQTLSNGMLNPFRNITMADAALATSAAPTYFPPHEIDGYGYFADGGVFANNPTMAAVAELSRNGVPIDRIKVISLGTGISASGIPASAIGDRFHWGIVSWMNPIEWEGVPAMATMNLMFDATEQAATSQAQEFLGANIVRGNVTLPQPFGLDDWKDVQQLVDLTNDYIQSGDWAQVRDWVASNW